MHNQKSTWYTKGFFLEFGPILTETVYWWALQPIITEACSGQLTAQSLIRLPQMQKGNLFLCSQERTPKGSQWETLLLGFCFVVARTRGLLNDQSHSMDFTLFQLVDVASNHQGKQTNKQQKTTIKKTKTKPHTQTKTQTNKRKQTKNLTQILTFSK